MRVGPQYVAEHAGGQRGRPVGEVVVAAAADIGDAPKRAAAGTFARQPIHLIAEVVSDERKARLASPVANVRAAGSSGATGRPSPSTRSRMTSSSQTCNPSPWPHPTACTPISVEPQRL